MSAVEWKNDTDTQASLRAQWHLIRPGDRVRIKTPHGGERTGRVVIQTGTHCVLNLGGKHGTPGVADAGNFVRHWKQATKGTK